MHDHLMWREVRRRKAASCPIFDVYVSERRSADGKTGKFTILTAPDWVNVIPVVRNGAGEECFLMVRQYRHGMEGLTVEFPAGLVAPAENPLHAAERELLEETGRKAGRMSLLGKVSPNPAFMTNWCWTYLAEDLGTEGPGMPDDLEILDLLEVPVREVEARVGEGEYVNSLVMVALLWYTRRRTP